MLNAYIEVIKAIYVAAEQIKGASVDDAAVADKYQGLLSLGQEALSRLAAFHQEHWLKSIKIQGADKDLSTKLFDDVTTQGAPSFAVKFQYQEQPLDFIISFATTKKTFAPTSTLESSDIFIKDLLKFCQAHSRINSLGKSISITSSRNVIT